MIDSTLIENVKKLLLSESEAIKEASDNIDQNFVTAVKLILNIKGRVIVTGMGKPGYIAQKFAATLMSTGTPANFLHPAEAIHGDLGMVTKFDLIVAISNSGETNEILNILPTLKKIGTPIISICGNVNSTLALAATCQINSHISREICPLNLAPTTSTTVQLALTDALAISVMEAKQFSTQDFAFYHPGGSLGQIRLLTTEQLLNQTKRNPQIEIDKKISDGLFVMTESGVGAVMVVDKHKQLLGLITDGDIRRYLKSQADLLNQTVDKLMTSTPTTILTTQLASDALMLMQNHQPKPITVLPVIDSNNQVKGIIHITDLVKFN